VNIFGLKIKLFDRKPKVDLAAEKLKLEQRVYGDLSEEWQDFFSTCFGIKFPFSDVKLPENPDKFERIIFDPGSKLLPYGNLLIAARRVFKVEIRLFSGNLDGVREEEWGGFADPQAVWCENVAELRDRHWKLETTPQRIRTKKIQTLALRHMMLFHLMRYREDGVHLDSASEEIKTRCSWSLLGNGEAATIQFSKNALIIGTNRLDDCFPCSQDRIAVLK
jgi:hypothetical protein